MLAQKEIHKCSYAIRSATTELLNIETFAEAQDMVQTGIEDAIAVCCLRQKISPIPYIVLASDLLL